jgi:hypothetical protein
MMGRAPSFDPATATLAELNAHAQAVKQVPRLQEDCTALYIVLFPLLTLAIGTLYTPVATVERITAHVVRNHGVIL